MFSPQIRWCSPCHGLIVFGLFVIFVLLVSCVPSMCLLSSNSTFQYSFGFGCSGIAALYRLFEPVSTSCVAIALFRLISPPARLSCISTSVVSIVSQSLCFPPHASACLQPCLVISPLCIYIVCFPLFLFSSWSMYLQLLFLLLVLQASQICFA